jgi:cardiolipin synthase
VALTLPELAWEAERERSLLDQAFSRAAGAPLIEGNAVRLLRDATENYPAWLEAIAGAERYIYFESYIIRDDHSGRQFAEALMAKAQEGVAVRVLYDWMGALGKTHRRFWSALRRAGIEVRCFNPIRLRSPVGWVHRDHRKSLIVDGRVGFITGLCIGDCWVGDPSKDQAPWRDTGIEVRGPAVTDIAKAFAKAWAVTGTPLPLEQWQADASPPVGDVVMRIVASEPDQAGLLRLDELVAAAARKSLWLTDAYFVGIGSYVQALRAAALDGVDVRLLVPGGTDIPILRPLSRAGYRPLLQAGIRVFEWNGPMIHAKTAVADARWARVGSSNLNVASWLGNYELDAVIEDAGFARTMMDQYEEDLKNSTEILLPLQGRRLWHRREGAQRQRRRSRPSQGDRGSAGRAVAGAVRLGNTVTAAVTDHRVLQPADARIIAITGIVLILVAAAFVMWPRLLALPAALVLVWIGGALLTRAFRLLRRTSPILEHRGVAERPSSVSDRVEARQATDQRSSSSDDSAGPEITLPFGVKREP